MPMSRAELEIPLDGLRNLPEGASFQKRSGQANMSLATKGNSIIATATCDSLQRDVEYYAELYFSTLEELEEMQERSLEAMKEEKGCSHTPLLSSIITLSAGIIVGMTVTLIIKTRRNG